MKKRKEETGDLFTAGLDERVKKLENKVELQNETLKAVLDLVRNAMG